MKIIEILENPENYFGKPIKIEGFLVDLYDCTYIAPDIENVNKTSESILISEPEFIQKVMLSDAPPYGGGKNSYPYNVAVEGNIFKTNNSPFSLELKNITSAYLEDEGEVFPVNIGNINQ
jgi:hypothetical protein